MPGFERGSDVGAYLPFNITANQTPKAAPITYPKPAGQVIYTTTTTTITGAASPGASNVVTVAALDNIKVGTRLRITNGGTNEIVTVTAINTGTPSFTALFISSYSGTSTITSITPSYLGMVVINNAGTTAVLTLYNGHPDSSTGTKKIATIAVGSQDHWFNCYAEFGLYYTLTSGAAPDITVMYLDAPIQR